MAFELHAYSLDSLRGLIAKHAHANAHTIDAKPHVTYFDRYLSYLNAKTVLVEEEYTDRDFLEDFAGYYVRCFKDYPRKCARLHFFDTEVDEQAFCALLGINTSPLTPDWFQNSYLGFIVVKPLPLTVIGRTCLRTFPSESHRDYPVTRTYEVNLFGLKLTVDSLAYQEQDSVAAACATSALWSAFNGTGKQFQHHIPSPVEITKAGTAHVPHDTRTFPNNGGLTSIQMADAIRSVGLEPCMVGVNDEWVMRGTMYAYLRGQIPLLLGIELYDSGAPIDVQTGRPVPFGFHAIAAAGFSLDAPSPVNYPGSSFAIRAFRMSKIYAHDDQVGPFARMEFLNGTNLQTSWPNGPSGSPTHAFPRFILIPLYHKIRIPFATVLVMVNAFNSLIDEMLANKVLTVPEQIEWDIYLSSVNTLKLDMKAIAALFGKYRISVLTKTMPRFIWRTTALVAGTPVIDLLFDATDIEQGASFVGVVQYDPALGQILTQVAQGLVAADAVFNRPDKHIIEWLANPSF